MGLKVFSRLSRLRSLKNSLFKSVAFILLTILMTVLSINYGMHDRFPVGISPSAAQVARDPWLWPFASNSIWNLPIGGGAKYQPANLPPVNAVTVDFDLLYVIPKGSPNRPLYDPGSWTKRCSGKTTYENLSIALPDSLIVPDAITIPEKYSTPNNVAALLQPDGRTIIQLEPMSRCVKGGPVYGYRYPKKNVDLYGAGIEGSHFGSGLSAIGGTIRKGELIGNEPIHHALKIEFWEQFIHYNPQSQTPGYRWPAAFADSAAKASYKGKNPELVMGSLLAISPKLTEKSLGLVTPAGKKLFHALQDYGAYHVDVTGQSTYAIAVEPGVDTEFKKTYGYSMEPLRKDNSPYYTDCMKLLQNLSVITNNQPTTIGGGGHRRAPLAPRLVAPPLAKMLSK
jgi:hypothetical protein